MQIQLDPSEHSGPELACIADFLRSYAVLCGYRPAPTTTVPVEVRADTSSIENVAKRLAAAPAVTLDPADSPDAGIPSPAAVIAQQGTDALMSSGSAEAAAAFGIPEQTAAQAFGIPATVTDPTPTIPLPPNVVELAQGIQTAPQVPQPPAATPAPTPAPELHNLTELDSQGLPWDGRIHSAKKTKIANGQWRKKNGIHEAHVSDVEKQLRALMAAPSIPAPPVANAAPHVPPVPQPPVTTPAPVTLLTLPIPAPQVPPVPQPPVATPAPQVPQPPAASADPKGPWTALLMQVATASQAGKITPAEADAISAKYGVPALPLLVNRLDLVPTIAAEVMTLIASR